MVAVYAPVVFALFAAYALSNNIDVRSTILRHWRWGAGIGIILGAVLILTVQRQDASPRPEGWPLVFDVAWLQILD